MTISRHRFAQWLAIGSLAYLAVPYVFFLAGWLAWYWAAAFLLLFAVALLLVVREVLRPPAPGAGAATHGSSQGREPAAAMAVGASSLAAIFLLILVWVGLSGMGGFGHQHQDWQKHNLILSDLIQHPWPVHYLIWDIPVSLVFYIAYYLPAAAIGKVSDWNMANNVLAAISLAGVMLSAGWVVLFVWRRPLAAVALSLLFSGLDLIGYPVALWLWPAYTSHLETPWIFWDEWPESWQYSSAVTQIIAVPHQAIAGWLVAALVLYTVVCGLSRHAVVLVAALSLLWSPFVALGIAPILLVDFLRVVRAGNGQWREYISIPNFTGLAIACLLALFYATKGAVISPLFDEGFKSSLILAQVATAREGLALSLMMIFFIFVEVGVWVLFVRATRPPLWTDHRWLLWTATGWLCILPLARFGSANDLVMRASIPALFIIMVFAIQGFLWKTHRRSVFWTGVVLFFLAAAAPLHVLASQANHMREAGTLRAFSRSSQDDIVDYYQRRPHYVRQYISRSDAPFFRLFARSQGLDPQGIAMLLLGDALMLEHASVDQRNVDAGASAQLMLRLRAVEETDRNYTLGTLLLDDAGQVIWKQQSWPSGRPTGQAEDYAYFFDTRQISIPAATPSGIYRLMVDLTDPETHKKVDIFDVQSGAGLGDMVQVAYVVVANRDELAQVQPLDQPIDFGGELALTGAGPAAVDRDASPAGELRLQVQWRATGQPAHDYTAFLHLVDAGGTIVAQDDHALGGLAAPTRSWGAGMTVPDTFRLHLPDSLPPGVYNLRIGVYDTQSGARLPVAPVQGSDGVVELMKVEVE